MNKQEEEMIRELKSLEINAPIGLWNEIESTLKARNRKRTIVITTWVSAATLALLFSIGGYFILQKETIVNEPLTANTSNQSTTAKTEDSISANIEDTSTKTLDKSINIKENTSLPSPEQSDSSIQEFVQTKQEQSDIPQRIKLIEPEKLDEKSVILDKLHLKTSIENRKYDLLASSDIKDSKRNGSWYLSASGFPVYSYHSAGVANKTGTERQSGISSFGGAISVRYEFSNRISIESGLSLGFMGQKEKNLYLSSSKNPSLTILSTSNNEYTNNYGTLTASNSDYTIGADAPINNRISSDVGVYKIDALQKFRYLEIPLLIAKNFSYKKINLFVKGGLSAGVLVQNLLNLQGQNISLSGKTTGVDKFITTAITSVGVSIPLFKRSNLIIEPSLKLGLKPLEHSNTKSYPFSSYIKFGVEVPI